MARRGGGSHLKRLNAPRIAVLKNRKRDKWLFTTVPGPHNKESSVALAVVLRDILGVVKTGNEAKKSVRQGKVKVDGRVVREPRYPVGFGDVLTLINHDGSEDHYLVVYNIHGRMVLKPIKDPEKSKTKICKVVNKYMLPKARIGITLHDGKSLIADNDVKPGYSIKVQIPENKIAGMIKLEPGVRCFIMKGKHIGHHGVIKDIKKEADRKLVTVESEGKDIVTVADYVIAVDDDWMSLIA
ncbi:hypothetical protein J7K41_03135 [Candidatus Micrarchaeota archaeon]|nr:hypothetical protein [Candidatus Micrarchaeota archaeon]